jgi:sugar lactone lactonase YvrE
VGKVSFGPDITNLAIDPAGNVVYSDTNLMQVRRLNLTTGLLETVAGVGLHPIGENGPAVAAVLSDADGDLAFLPSGELLLSDMGNALVRKIDQNGNISTIAGGGVGRTKYPLPALGAFVNPAAVRTDTAGRIYVVDPSTVYRIDREGIISPFAGGGGPLNGLGVSGDGGPALGASLCQPWDIALDSDENLFIADTNNNRVRRVDAKTGIITTVAGSGPVNGPEHYDQDGKGSYSGDGGPAIQATLNTPYGVVVDSQGNLFIADGIDPPRIRKVDTQGIITTFVTNPNGGYQSKLTFDGAGNMYVMQNDVTLMRYSPTGVPTVIAGNNPQGFSGDGGPATQAQLSGGIQASGIAIDTEGNIFFVDGQNSRVRAIRLGAAPTPQTIATNPGRLVNLSCRAQVGTGANQLIVGFAVSTQGASGSEPLLIRASGPALAPFGVTGVLSDPQLTLNNTNGILAANNGWNGNAQIASTAISVGAFAWNIASSLDSGLVESLHGGAYTAQVAGSSGDTGVALAEVYDATPAGTFTASSPHLVNLSARVMVGKGSNILIVGFVIGGTTSKTVLIRGSGPALTAFGVSGVLPDPELQLYQSNGDGTSTLLQSNTGWGGNTQIAATAASVGAFSWGSSATPDSAILVSLSPGSYTAQVSGASGDTGIALVEVYDVQ